MMPSYLPSHRQLVLVSGLFEILGGAALLAPSPRLQRVAAYGLVALLVAVFPANVHVAVHNVPLGGYMSHPAYQWTRLLFQPLLIWWALWCTSEGQNFRARSPHLRARRTRPPGAAARLLDT